MKVCIIGFGLIGKKRARSLKEGEFVGVYDINEKAYDDFPGLENVYKGSSFEDAIENSGCDAVVVATSNNELIKVAKHVIKNGKHVLIEKPGARSIDEFNQLEIIPGYEKLKIKIGYNLRFHPGMAKAKEIIESGAVGPLMFIRGNYGHGGRLGYEKEWRSDASISGGGELIDQGVHLIDLAQFYFGEINLNFGQTKTLFWDMKVDDNAFFCLEGKNNEIAWLNVSCSEWKNNFRLDIYGKVGKLSIEGLGGSYGPEKLTWYKMKPEMGIPDIETFEFPKDDNSWDREFDNFRSAIDQGTPLSSSFNESKRVLEIIKEIYKENDSDYYQKST